jgi:hypothetical protein
VKLIRMMSGVMIQQDIRRMSAELAVTALQFSRLILCRLMAGGQVRARGLGRAAGRSL